MVCLTREQILAAPVELQRVEVTIKEWGGGPFFIHELDGFARDEWEGAVRTDIEHARVITIIRTLFHADGTRVFKDEDADALRGGPGRRGQSGRLLARLSEKARRLNRLGEEDVEIAKGNSEPDRSEDSVSA